MLCRKLSLGLVESEGNGEHREATKWTCALRVKAGLQFLVSSKEGWKEEASSGSNSTLVGDGTLDHHLPSNQTDF